MKSNTLVYTCGCIISMFDETRGCSAFSWMKVNWQPARCMLCHAGTRHRSDVHGRNCQAARVDSPRRPFHYATHFTTRGLLYLAVGKVAIFQPLVIARPAACYIICRAFSPFAVARPRNPGNPLSVHIRSADLDTRITPITTREITLSLTTWAVKTSGNEPANSARENTAASALFFLFSRTRFAWIYFWTFFVARLFLNNEVNVIYLSLVVSFLVHCFANI